MEIAVAIITIIPAVATLVVTTITNKRISKQEELRQELRTEYIGLIDNIQLDNCKNYLVQAIAKVQTGSELTAVERERYWENYDTYVKLGGNSYIHTETERLKKEGKL